MWKRLRAGGVKVLPTIYNDANGYGTTLLPQFLAMAANPDSFIRQAVALAVVRTNAPFGTELRSIPPVCLALKLGPIALLPSG